MDSCESRMSGKDWAAQKARAIRSCLPPRNESGGECEYTNAIALAQALETVSAHLPHKAEESLWVIVNHLR